MDPRNVPLPPSEGTNYLSSSPMKNWISPQSEADGTQYASSPEAAPSTRASKRLNANIFDSETPVVSAAFNPFQTPFAGNEQEKPQPRAGRPGSTGGKYHPGTGPVNNPTVVESSFRPQSRQSSRHSLVGSEVDGDAPDARNDDESEGEAEGSGDDMDTEMEALDDNELQVDHTMAIGLGSSVASQLGGYSSSVRARRQLSPGQTPAKKRGNVFASSFNTNFTENSEMEGTPRASTFAPLSLFASVHKTPLLSAASPHKMNTMQRLAAGTPISLSAELRAREAEVRQLKELLAAGVQDQQSLGDFVNFSPEKKAEDKEDGPLTVKKRRTSPRKHLGSPIGGGASRTFRSSPIKPPALFEGIAKPITAEERKRARRRRVTQEFRDFSAIDIETLKTGGFLPSLSVKEVIEEAPEAMEAEQEAVQAADMQGVKEPEKMEVTEHPATDISIKEPMSGDEEGHQEGEVQIEEEFQQDEVKVRVEPEEKPHVMAENVHDMVQESDIAIEQEEEEVVVSVSPEERRSSVVVPPLNRTRPYRSSSAPPVPRPDSTEMKAVAARFEANTPMDIDAVHDVEIATLKRLIIELQDKLEIADVQIDRLQADLVVERRRRVTADKAREFVEMERKFGVCCEHNPGFKQPTEKLGAAAVQLPNSSPPHAEALRPEERKRVAPKSRLGGVGTRPASRFDNRPASRIGEHSTARSGGTSTSSKHSTTTAPVTRKRAREEPTVAPGKKAPVPARPEKKVLSASAAGNAILGGQTSALTKKPEKVVGRNLRSTSGAATARPGALARGARR